MDVWVTHDVCILESKDMKSALEEVCGLYEKYHLGLIVTVDDNECDKMGLLPENEQIRHFDLHLSEYPKISDWEIKRIISIIKYEGGYDRRVAFWFRDEYAARQVLMAIMSPCKYMITQPPKFIPGKCAGCNRGGCKTTILGYSDSVENMSRIFSKGELSSPSILDNININSDYPEDYSKYVSLDWGNCSLGIEKNTLGVVFVPKAYLFFRYDDILSLPGAICDGYKPVKVLNRINLEDCLAACVLPEEYSEQISSAVPENIADRIHYLESEDCTSEEEWLDKVYQFIEELEENI